MRRRTLLRWLASAPGALRAQTASFPGNQEHTLRALAAVVLPSELGAAGLDRTATAFAQWVRDYRPGAEMEHGYGLTRLRNKPPSPAPVYLQQLESLRSALAASDVESRRHAVQSALQEAKITELPRTPDGRHVAADLMAFYFQSSDANDRCYRAAIGRDRCRGLPGSDQAPPPLERPA